MKVAAKDAKSLPTDSNYIDLAAKQFIFNKYKTAKKYGQQILDIPEPLFVALSSYLKYHPGRPATRKGATFEPFPFLVDASGKALTAANAITRALNKIFGRKVGSSLLRHIYLSNKYNVSEMSDDATAMAHSMTTQREYLRKDGPPEDDEEKPAGGAGISPT